jgi:hypothetical protein
MKSSELNKIVNKSYKEYKNTFGKEPTSCLVNIRYDGSNEPCDELQTIVIDNGNINPNDFQDEVLYVTTSYENIHYYVGRWSIDNLGFEIVDFISFN